ncbi:AAA family ATPase [Amycolatopsis mediterranei]|uniref:AAA family ATPase n=1 Tax=Amycolatopsis mediterranei TaxID=33910 RepID=UPI0004018AD7|nr:AAA family ATPase [Amycolatopsis mediterranei]
MRPCSGAPLLIVVGGLPATGKTTVAAELARRTGFAFLRVDTIEHAILRSTALGRPLGPVGYVVAREVAAGVLRAGVSVIAECVNPLAVTRDAWRATGIEAGARVPETEIVCSDPAEHRRRAETRDPGVPGSSRPPGRRSWPASTNRGAATGSSWTPPGGRSAKRFRSSPRLSPIRRREAVIHDAIQPFHGNSRLSGVPRAFPRPHRGIRMPVHFGSKFFRGSGT